jgi:phosphoglycolate phosphatase
MTQQGDSKSISKSLAKPLLVFDLDGTLAETASDLVATLNVILAREGLRSLSLQEARPMIGAGMRTLIRRGFEAEGVALSDQKLEELFLAFLAHYQANIAIETQLYPGVSAALDRFEAAGWAFAVCTNKLEQSAVLLLQALGIADRFVTICGQNTFHVCKPHGDALRLTIERAGGDIHRAVMVGDSKTDIDTARNAKVPVVAMTFGYTDQPVANYAPDRAIDHFDDLWSAVAEVAGSLSGPDPNG